MRYFLLLLLLPLLASADDTAAIQAALNSHAGGTYTLPLIGTYHISSQVTVPANTIFHINGNFITTTQTTQAAIKVNGGSTVDNGFITGPWNHLTTPGSASGGSGMQLIGSNITITNVTIESFQGYGMVAAGAYANLSITYNTIINTGYIGFYYDAEANTAGSVFSHNTIDRSALPPTSIIEACADIRASAASTTDSTSNWTITYNNFSMPLRPANATAEGIECRQMRNSLVAYNTCFQGTISFSFDRCGEMTVSHNVSRYPKLEGLEFNTCHYSTSNYNSVSNSFGDGILEDGYLSSTPTYHSYYIYHNYDTIRNSGSYGIHLYNNTKHIFITGCVIYNHSAGVYIQQSDSVAIVNTNINGHGRAGSAGIYSASSPGNNTINGGAIDSCTNAVYAYNTISSAVVNNIVGTTVRLAGTHTQFGSFFTNGAHYGTNIRFITGFFTFPALAGVTYGAGNITPGATSNIPITYTSGNTGIATIVSGQIHITGTGTVSITATTADTAASQPLVVSKAGLTITADDKHKAHGSPNPTLTATYSGLVYSENSSVVSGLVLATTAVTASPVGTYPITPSGGTAANYTLSRVPGVLTVTNGVSTGVRGHFRHVVIKRQ